MLCLLDDAVVCFSRTDGIDLRWNETRAHGGCSVVARGKGLKETAGFPQNQRKLDIPR